MRIEESKTSIRKGRSGWEGKTIRTEKNQTFEIFTSKGYSGILSSSVYKVNVSKDDHFTCTSYSPLTDQFMSINHGKITATEKAVTDAHYAALAAFDIKINELPAAEVAPKIPEIGDILFMDGYGKTKTDDGNNWIIYKIDDSKMWGPKYHCIEKDTLELRILDHVRPWSEKFGIGHYFEKGFNLASFKIDENQLSNMLIDAQVVKFEKYEKELIAAAAKAKAEAERKEYLNQFTTADVRKTTAIIKSHCMKNYPISKITVNTEGFSGGDSMDVTYHSAEKIEALEIFINNFKYGYYDSMNEIYEYHRDKDIILENHILRTYKYVFCYFVETPAAAPAPAPVPELTAAEKLEILLSACGNFEAWKEINRAIEYSREITAAEKTELLRKATAKNYELFKKAC